MQCLSPECMCELMVRQSIDRYVRTVLGPAPMRIARPDGAIIARVARSIHWVGRVVYTAVRLSMFTAVISDVRAVSDAR